MSKVNCSATVIMVTDDCRLGFVKRDGGDSFAYKLVAAGGRVEESDGELIDSVPYWSVECAAIRELEEETGLKAVKDNLFYFCSLTIPANGRIILSYYVYINSDEEQLVASKGVQFFSREQLEQLPDDAFAPGMRKEALLLLDIV